MAKINYQHEKRKRDLAKRKKKEEKMQRKLDKRGRESDKSPDAPPEETG